MTSSEHLKVWLLAIRPKTLGAAVAPVMIGTIMAYEAGVGHVLSALAALLGAFLIQIGTNFANDYFDFIKGADTEERLGPTRVTQAGLVTPKTMLFNFIFIFALAVLVGVYLVYRGGWPIILIGILSIASGILYTGGPYPLGYLGLGDVFVLVFFGPVAVGGTFYVQALEISQNAIIAGFGTGFVATALLAVNNLRDEPTDKKVGKKTLAVRLGTRFARTEYLLCILLALMIPVYLAWSTQAHWFGILTLMILIPGRSAIQQIVSGAEGEELNQTLGTTGKMILIYSLLFSIGWWIG